MYGLPQGLDLSFIEQSRLDSICVSRFVLIFHFDDNIKITVMSAMSCTLRDSTHYQLDDDFRDAIALIVVFIGEKVESAVAEGIGTLRLTFEGGAQLFFYDDSDMYESYVIKHGDDTIVV